MTDELITKAGAALRGGDDTQRRARVLRAVLAAFDTDRVRHAPEEAHGILHAMFDHWIEIGTLVELNAQVGDVVQYCGQNPTGYHRTITSVMDGKYRATLPGFNNDVGCNEMAEWRMISRSDISRLRKALEWFLANPEAHPQNIARVAAAALGEDAS